MWSNIDKTSHWIWEHGVRELNCKFIITFMPCYYSIWPRWNSIVVAEMVRIRNMSKPFVAWMSIVIFIEICSSLIKSGGQFRSSNSFSFVNAMISFSPSCPFLVLSWNNQAAGCFPLQLFLTPLCYRAFSFYAVWTLNRNDDCLDFVELDSL